MLITLPELILIAFHYSWLFFFFSIASEAIVENIKYTISAYPNYVFQSQNNVNKWENFTY